MSKLPLVVNTVCFLLNGCVKPLKLVVLEFLVCNIASKNILILIGNTESLQRVFKSISSTVGNVLSSACRKVHGTVYSAM